MALLDLSDSPGTKFCILDMALKRCGLRLDTTTTTTTVSIPYQHYFNGDLERIKSPKSLRLCITFHKSLPLPVHILYLLKFLRLIR